MMETLLPFNATELERSVETVFRAGLATSVPTDTVWSAALCPSALLPFLAWSLSIDDWDPNWVDDQKRSVIAASAFVHRHKGTPGAIRRALNALNLGIEFAEWFDYGGEPFTFRAVVDVTQAGLTEASLANIYSAITNTKNARSYLSALEVYLKPEGCVRFACAVSIGLTTRVGAAA